MELPAGVLDGLKDATGGGVNLDTQEMQERLKKSLDIDMD